MTGITTQRLLSDTPQSRVGRTNTSAPTSSYKRAYKACESCRKTKAKCDLESSATACSKCLREQRECIFPPHRSMKRAKLSNDNRASDQLAQPATTQDEQRRASSRSPTNSGYATTSEEPGSAVQTGRPERRLNFTSSPHPRGETLAPPSAVRVEVNDTQHQTSDSDIDTDRLTQTIPVLAAESDAPDNLQRHVMQTFVTSSKDAMGLLFRAAEQIDSEDSDEQQIESGLLNDGSAAAGNTYNIQSPSMPSPGLASSETLDLWDQHRFVRQGWFTAREAVAYLEFFFRNLSPLSPVADSYYADHKNHRRLILEEPLLCCTLLMISSRHYTPPGSSLASRADFIHMRLWKHVEHLIQKITFGMEKYSVGKTRTLGSIQALLLITEWHPRALHFPPETDGWDSSLAPSVDDTFQPGNRKTDAGRRWREDVFEPAKRSDRMSWMLVGIAVTLAHELGVFDHPDEDDGQPGSVSNRRTLLRTRRILFLYTSQLSLRLGCTNVFPQVHNQTITYSPENDTQPQEQINIDREIMISKWIEITKLLTTATEMFFASPSSTRQMLRSSRYVSLLDHFQSLLARWHNDYLRTTFPSVAEPARQMLLIDYHYVRMYINSVAMQALVERASSYNSGDIWLDQNFLRSEFAQDFRFVKEVRDASTEILSVATKLAEENILQNCPVRVFLRIVSASIFSLKTVSLGAREADMTKSLGQLERCIEALSNSRADDIHLSSRYAMLIARHVRRFRRNFRIRKAGIHHTVPVRVDDFDSQHANAVIDSGTAPGRSRSEYSLQSQHRGSAGSGNEVESGGMDAFAASGAMPLFDFEDGGSVQDWLAQPFNSQVAPFGTDWLQPATGLAIDSLDFLWNMST